jgi:hypothetical protein
VPVGVLEPVVTVRVELPPAVTDVGLKLALAPDGRPETERLTLWALPDVTAVLMVVLAEPPWVAEMLPGLAAMEKSFVPQFANLKEAMRVFQLKAPFEGMYSFVYQKVQSSIGSTAMRL